MTFPSDSGVERSLTGCGGSNTLAVSPNDAKASSSSHARFANLWAAVLANYGAATI